MTTRRACNPQKDIGFADRTRLLGLTLGRLRFLLRLDSTWSSVSGGVILLVILFKLLKIFSLQPTRRAVGAFFSTISARFYCFVFFFFLEFHSYTRWWSTFMIIP